MLARTGSTAETPLFEPLTELPLAADDEREAIGIVGRLATPGLWGWKDPRTLLFIHFWLELLPGARLVIPIRHPLEIYYSYLKRIPAQAIFSPAGIFFPAISAQFERMRQIADTHAPRVLILDAQTAFKSPARLRDKIARFLDTELPPGQLPILHDREFTSLRLSSAVCNAFAALYPRAARSYEHLNALASIPFEPAGAPQDVRFGPAVHGPDELLPLLLASALPEGEAGFIECVSAIFANMSYTLAYARERCRALETQLEKAPVTLPAQQRENGSRRAWRAVGAAAHAIARCARTQEH